MFKFSVFLGCYSKKKKKKAWNRLSCPVFICSKEGVNFKWLVFVLDYVLLAGLKTLFKQE